MRPLVTIKNPSKITLSEHFPLHLPLSLPLCKEMKARANFRISEFTNPGGTTSYRVTGTAPDGKRVRENFQTLQEATGRRQELEVEGLNTKPSARLKQTRLSEEQILDAEHAIATFEGKPFTLSQAAKFFVEHYQDPVRPIKLADAFDEFLDQKTKANSRPESIRNLRTRVGFLVSTHGNSLVSEIQPETIRGIIHRPGRGPVTCDNDRRALSVFFNWAARQGYCAKSPTAGIDPIRCDRDEPEILPLETVRRLLAAAIDYKDGRLVPYLALGLFAAIRPTELARITWKEIDLGQGTVTLGAKLAKMRQRRIVRLSENCLEWLRPHAPRRTPIKGTNWRRDFDAIKTAAGILEWTQDILRHTGISCHLAHFEHEGQTAAWAGNSPNIVQRHYKGLVPRQDATAFWEIRPSDFSGNVVSPAFGQAAG
jgi:integrase